VILLHGWPYDIHSYVDVAPILAASGYRVIVPYLRGYGSLLQATSTAAASGTAYRNKFSGPYSHRILKGIGHNVPQEAPQPFAQAVIAADHSAS
jgi:pimeloyl-ACP methyl ester carboxylesterase